MYSPGLLKQTDLCSDLRVESQGWNRMGVEIEVDGNRILTSLWGWIRVGKKEVRV